MYPHEICLTDKQQETIYRLVKDICANGKADKLNFNTSNGFNILNTLTPYSAKGDIDFVGNQIGNALINEIALYRGKLNPILQSYIEKVKSKVGNNGVSKAANYELKEIDIPRIIQDADSLGLFDNPIDNEAIMKQSTVDIPVVDIQNIVLKETELNSYVDEMLTAEDRQNPGCYFAQMLDKKLDPLNCLIDLECNIKAWLIAKFVKENKLAEIGMSESRMKDIIDSIATRIHIAMQAIESYTKLERLFLINKRCPNTGKNYVYVFKPTYDACVNEIGLVDAILGLAVKEKFEPEHTYKAFILAKKEELIKIWDAYLTTDKFSNALAEQERLRLAFTISLREVVEELGDDLKTLHSGNVDFSTLDTEVDKLLKSSKLSNDDTFIEKMSVVIIGNYLFNKTNQFKFFKYVEKFLGTDSKLKVDDVVPLVLTVFVIDYLMAQMNVM